MSLLRMEMFIWAGYYTFRKADESVGILLDRFVKPYVNI